MPKQNIPENLTKALQRFQFHIINAPLPHPPAARVPHGPCPPFFTPCSPFGWALSPGLSFSLVFGFLFLHPCRGILCAHFFRYVNLWLRLGCHVADVIFQGRMYCALLRKELQLCEHTCKLFLATHPHHGQRSGCGAGFLRFHNLTNQQSRFVR